VIDYLLCRSNHPRDLPPTSLFSPHFSPAVYLIVRDCFDNGDSNLLF
jgi:hypothetical protein